MTVTVDGVAVALRPGETVLDAITRAGFRWPWVCRRGRCAACKVELVSGLVAYTAMSPRRLFTDEERAAGICLSCTAVPVGDIAIRVPR
jgi:CDP-4-dehydro-6-deoxyglucose reductase